jgi:FkbM family methyltransferase
MRIVNHLAHSFAPDLLEQAEVALDCGANRGEFALWLSEHSNAQIHSFEPDPRLFSTLPSLPRVRFHPIAIDGESGEFELALGRTNCSSAVYREHGDQVTAQVQKTSLDDFCATNRICRIDFLKLDIEGAELSVLEKTSDSLLQATVQITVEFHDFLRRGDIPRIVRIFDRMARLGFYGIRFSQFTWGDCLFLNRRLVPLSILDRFGIHIFGRIIPGVGRLAKRQFKRFSPGQVTA